MEPGKSLGKSLGKKLGGVGMVWHFIYSFDDQILGNFKGKVEASNKLPLCFLLRGKEDETEKVTTKFSKTEETSPIIIQYDYIYIYLYRKIPKLSPSKYKPPKLVTQKTLR